MRCSTTTLVFALLLTVTGAARSTAPTCGHPPQPGLCSGGTAAGIGTLNAGTGICTGAPDDCGAPSRYVS